MAVARLVDKVGEENPFTRAYARFEAFFDKLLRWSLEHKLVVVGLSLVSVLIGFQLLKAVKKGVLPSGG
jgi:HAE1 family hydrophobic/amphiphilic exporter-1